MDDAKREPEDAAANAADASRRRPQPILDLKATELGGGETSASAEAEPAAQSARPAGDAGKAAAPPPPPPPRAARRGPSLVAAALLGAVAGAGAAFAIVWSLGLIDRADESAARIAGLETQLRTLAARPLADPASVKAIGERAAAGERALQAANALQQRVAEVEAALKQPQAAAAPPADGRLDKLDAATQSLGGEIAAVRQRLDEIAAAARAARETAARTAGSSDAAVASSNEEIEALSKRVQTLEASAKTLQARLAAPAPDRDKAARFAAAAVALRGAVERGEAYQNELAATRALVDDPARIKPLEAAAAEGIVSARELARDLSRLIVRMRQSAEAGQEAGDGLLGRLQASAAKLVRIRPVGDEGPPSEADALAAVEEKAARADIAGALAEAEKLPPELRAPLADWIAKAKTRVAALDAARSLAREALAALAAAPARP